MTVDNQRSRFIIARRDGIAGNFRAFKRAEYHPGQLQRWVGIVIQMHLANRRFDSTQFFERVVPETFEVRRTG